MKVYLKYFIITAFLTLVFGKSYSQTSYIDSLSRAITGAKDDTNKVNKLYLLSTELYQSGKFDTARICALSQQTLSEKLGDKIGEAKANMNVGITYWYQGSFPLALQYYLKALSLYKELGNKKGIASAYGNIGIIYDEQGNYSQALDNYLKALPIFKEIGNKRGEATGYSSIGVVYRELHNYKRSLEYHTQALQINTEIDNKIGIARDYGNLGNTYSDTGDCVKALEYDLKALSLYRELGNGSGIALNQGNISGIYLQLKNYTLAEAYVDSAIALSTRLGEKEILRDNYAQRAMLDSIKGKSANALADYKKYIRYRDELINDASTKKTVEEQMNFDFQQKQAAQKAEQDKKDALAEEDKRRQKIIIWSVAGGLILTLLFAGLILRSLRITRKQKDFIEKQKEKVEEQKTLIERQKELVEEKNKEILDSITYAKRLQDAILPPMDFITKYFPESFVLYKPKDIVAGDFYWMEKSGDNVLIAAADCTGHGVPGALVSVVCSNALNRSVKEFNITDTGKILDKVRELVLETFEKSDSNVQDGMDISLFCLNTNSKEFQWSGAYNSLWYVQNGEMKEIPGDKQPIGKCDNPKPFTTHSITLPIGEGRGGALYLFTDGYADQFGGPKGKKFRYTQLQELLLANASKSMEEQKRVLERTLNEWKGDLEQVDDILIIGIRV